MRIKKGTVYGAVVAEFRRRGLSTEGVTVKRPGGGSYYWVVKDGRIIGGYNHLNRVLTLTKDIVGE